jgi:hypothetical protein
LIARIEGGSRGFDFPMRRASCLPSSGAERPSRQ